MNDPLLIAPEDLRRTLSAALSRGGDFAEIFLEHRVYSSVYMEEDILKETSETIVIGAGVRVLRRDQTGYGYTNDLAPEKLVKAALTAAAIASSAQPRAKVLAARERNGPRRRVAETRRPAHRATLGRKIALVKEAYSAAQGFDPRIKKVKAGFSDSFQRVLIVNSDGLLVLATPFLRRRNNTAPPSNGQAA